MWCRVCGVTWCTTAGSGMGNSHGAGNVCWLRPGGGGVAQSMAWAPSSCACMAWGAALGCGMGHMAVRGGDGMRPQGMAW